VHNYFISYDFVLFIYDDELDLIYHDYHFSVYVISTSSQLLVTLSQIPGQPNGLDMQK
jgi:hypothetical protein